MKSGKGGQNTDSPAYIYIYTHIYMYIHTYAGPRLAWAKFVKIYENWRFCTFLKRGEVVLPTFERYYLGEVGHFYCAKPFPGNNPYLAQIITLRKWYFFFFWMCWNTCFTRVVWTSTQVCPKLGPTKRTFHILKRQDHLPAPKCTNNFCIFSCRFSKTKLCCWNIT